MSEQEHQERLPYRFILPRDLGAVKIMAYAEALECAYTAIRDGKQFVPDAGEELAVEIALYYQRTTLDGRQGTNDPALYQKTFIATFAQQFKRAIERLRAGEMIVDPALPDDERLVVFYHYAENALASRN